MRFLLLIALLFPASSTAAQADLWSHVNAQPGPLRTQAASLSDAQLKSLAHLLRRQKAEDIWGCESADLNDLIQGLQFESIQISARRNLVLAEAPAGCGRGGQGANGAMWVIRFDGEKPVLLATPKEFSGWLFSVESYSSHGYPDIILGWHMSAREANLSYFRFDGKTYHKIGAATLETDENGSQKIVVDPR